MLNEYDELFRLLPNDRSQSSDMQMIRKILEKAGPMTVVDLGCGIGRTYSLFKSLNSEIDWVGVDIEDSVESKQRKVGEFPFRSWDGSHIPMDDASVDLVYCHQVLEYVCSPQLVINEVSRILKQGGRFVGATSQFEPCVTGSLWNFKPLGFKFLLKTAGLSLEEIRPGIDGMSLIARAFLGKPKSFSKFFSSESPLNSLIELQMIDEKSDRKIAFEKLKYCGQFSFAAKKSQMPIERVPVITYHHHLPEEIKKTSRFKNGAVTNTVESFEGQMKWLSDNGYSTLDLAQFEKIIDGKASKGDEKKY